MRGSPITEVDNGCFNITKQEQDSQFFKAPVLPDIELTFPCFHDGLVDSLTGRFGSWKNFNGTKPLPAMRSLTGEYKRIPRAQLFAKNIK
ncbi:MAG: hypothetical protein PHY54_15200 [Methylococcales bacterium]|nr:hypothetical protein [Methylococcales bacterium]